MKFPWLFFVCLWLLLPSPLQSAEIPYIDEGEYIYMGYVPLEVGDYSAPFVVDWNNDGAKDLLVGQQDYGYINLLINEGTNLNPVFNRKMLLQAGGKPISTTYS